jgi:hypothetical protein
MNTNRLSIVEGLSDEALLVGLRGLAANCRASTADLIAHLAELARRRTNRGEGEGSLFMFCTRVLLLSQAAACNRIAAAYAARRFPVILDLLADGSVNLTTIRILAGHLTPENHELILREATGKTKEEVLVIKARLDPKPDVAASVRKLPVPAPAVVSRPADVADAPAPPAAFSSPSPAMSVSAPKPAIQPLAPERYRVQFTIDKETNDRVRRLQEMMRREIPSGDVGVLFGKAIALLLEQAEKKAFAATARPRAARGTRAGSRTIPAHVQRAVWARDAGRCAFVGRSGMRCSERAFLEFHHTTPHGHEGDTTAKNIALRCRAHNAYESEIVFGRFDPRADRKWLPAAN